jgi:hypothetical protein
VTFWYSLAGALAAALLYITFFGVPTVGPTQNAHLTALLSVYGDKNLSLDVPQKVADCTLRGPLPDHDCTPGSIFASTTLEIICTQGYTKTVRNVPVALKKQIYTMYGISYPQAAGSYEADHLIPLELGGSNDIANLFPEAANPRPGFREKDLVENYLHNEVCARHIDLAAAQIQIATDWLAVYNLIK